MLCTRSMNGPWLLFVSESGYGKRVPVSRFRSSPLNRVGLIGYKVHHNAKSKSIIKDKNPYHCFSSLHIKGGRLILIIFVQLSQLICLMDLFSFHLKIAWQQYS